MGNHSLEARARGRQTDNMRDTEYKRGLGHCPTSRECHGFTNPCGLVLRVTVGAGTGCEFVTLTQPVPMTRV